MRKSENLRLRDAYFQLCKVKYVGLTTKYDIFRHLHVKQGIQGVCLRAEEPDVFASDYQSSQKLNCGLNWETYIRTWQ